MKVADYGRLLPDIPLGTIIPPVFHQTYPRADMPEELARNVENLKKRNPGWTHRFYDDAAVERFIAEQYGPDILSYYRRISPDYGAARADLFRYLAVYRLGGVYLDIKSRAVRPMADVLRADDRFIVSRWRDGPGEVNEGFGRHPELAHLSAPGEIQQWHVIAAGGHPFLRAVILTILESIDRYRPWRDGVGKVGVLRLTGPIAYTLAITPLLGRHPHRAVADESALGLEYSILSGDRHQRLFRRHYAGAVSSVVKLTGWNRWLGIALEGALRVSQRALPLRRRIARARGRA